MKKFLLLAMMAAPVAAQMQTPAGTLSPAQVEAQQKKLDAAEDLLRAGKFDEAKAQLHEYLKIEPKNARALYDLGFAEEQTQQMDAAEKAYRNAIEADPKQFESRFTLGLLLARKDDVKGAREQLAVATTLTPLTGDVVKAAAFRALAQIDAQDRPADAKAELAQAIKLSSETDDDRQLEKQLSAGGPASTAPITASAETEESYRAALAAAPNDPRASAGLAQLLVKAGKGDEAAEVLQKAADAHPDDMVLKRMLAHLYMQTDAYDKALPLLAEITKDPNVSPELLDDYGNALIRNSKPVEAQKAFAQAVAKPDGFSSKEAYAAAAEHWAFAASANHDADTVLKALAIHDGIEAPTAPSLFLMATAHDRLHHVKLAMDGYRQFLKASGGKYPNEEWQAKHRIVALEHAK